MSNQPYVSIDQWRSSPRELAAALVWNAQRHRERHMIVHMFDGCSATEIETWLRLCLDVEIATFTVIGDPDRLWRMHHHETFADVCDAVAASSGSARPWCKEWFAGCDEDGEIWTSDPILAIMCRKIDGDRTTHSRLRASTDGTCGSDLTRSNRLLLATEYHGTDWGRRASEKISQRLRLLGLEVAI